MGSRYTDPERNRVDKEIAEIRERLTALESGAGLGNSSISKGSTTWRGGGSVIVEGGGDVRVHDGGSIVASDDDGEIFAVDTDPPRLFLRASLITELVEQIVEELLTSAAGQALAAFVFAQRVHGDYVATQETTTSLTYTDLSTTGPTVPDVPISSSGLAIAHVSAGIEANCAAPSGGGTAVSGDMGFAISGATTRAAGLSGQFLSIGNFDAAEETSNNGRLGITAVVDGLNEGDHTFTAKYRRVQGSEPIPFSNRTLVVIGL